MAPAMRLLHRGSPSLNREERVQGRSVALVAWLVAASVASAQSGAETLAGIPPQMYPPPGACRIWVDGVALAQQPPPMDCASAQRVVPPNGRVVFGVTARRPEELGVASGGGVDRRPEGGVDRRPSPTTPPPAPIDPRTIPGPQATSGCPDGNGDGWCDDVMRLPASTPARMPRMLSAVLYLQRRERTADFTQWLGDVQVRLRFEDRNRDNVPEQVLWLDQRGAPVQLWLDRDGDGYADQVGSYRGGQVARVVGGP
jgi:hypothetical protein